MSLLDALLLDPAPFNVWITYRTDGVKGSGTVSDPWDGSPKLANPLSITLARTGTTATATLSAGHGLQNGDVVVITGETTEPAIWNGTFTIWNVQATTFQYTMLSTPFYPSGSGTIKSAKVTSTRFDEIMASIAASGTLSTALIHIGPNPQGNPYLTAGYTEGGSNPWQLKPRMKLLGSGREVTVIKRMNGAAGGYVLGHDLTTGADYFELRDLTLDCNLTSAVPTGATCGAVRVMGDHVRLVRVRAKNWGCAASSGTCYVFALVLANPPAVPLVSNCGMEDCVADAPAKLTGTPANAGTVVMFHAGAPATAGVQLEGYARSPYIRNCFGQWDATITGTQARGLSMGWCRGGVVEGNHIHDANYGGPYQKAASTQDIIVRNNNYRNVLRGPFWDLGDVYPASPVALVSLVTDSSDTTGKTALATTNSDPNVAHGYQPGEHVRIVTNVASSLYDGIFSIKDVPAPNQFRYLMASSPGASAAAPFSHQKVFGAGRIVVEGNTIALATGSASIALHVYDHKIMENVPTDVFRDVIVRNNKIRYVDGAFDPSYSGDGIEVNGATNAIVANNVVEVAPSNPIRLFRCRNVTCQNNRQPSGTLIEGYDSDTARRYAELETDNDFALVMSLFNRRAR